MITLDTASNLETMPNVWGHNDLPEMTENFIGRQAEVLQANLFSAVRETGSCFSTHALETYVFTFEIGWSFAAAFTGYKTGSFVSAEHQINLLASLI